MARWLLVGTPATMRARVEGGRRSAATVAPPLCFLTVLYLLSFNRPAGPVAAPWWSTPIFGLLWLGRLPRFEWQILVWPTGFILSVLLSAFVSTDPSRNLVHAAKLLVIFFLLYPLLHGSERLARASFRAIVASALLNGFALLGGFLGQSWLASEGAERRWATLFANPGGLAKSGACVYLYALFLLLGRETARPRAGVARRLFGGCLLALAVIMVLCDGSRGVALGMIALTGVALAFGLRELRRGRISAVVVALSLVAAVLAPHVWPSESPMLDPRERVQRFVISAARLDTSSLDRDATYRTGEYRLLLSSGIRPFGAGHLGAVRSEFGAHPQVTHNAYLQALADLGVLGFVSFVGLSFAWLFRLRAFLRVTDVLPYGSERAAAYNALACIVLTCVVHLFSPIGVELPDWVGFLTGCALFHHVASMHNPPRYVCRAPTRSFRAAGGWWSQGVTDRRSLRKRAPHGTITA